MKEIHELEELRNSDDEVRSFKKVDGKVSGHKEEHAEGCSCGHCEDDHSHEDILFHRPFCIQQNIII